jgi:hypothetical protein
VGIESGAAVRHQTIWQYWVPFSASACRWRFCPALATAGSGDRHRIYRVALLGKSASVLRFYSGFSGAILICPLIISWVTKAMETITREAIGLPPWLPGMDHRCRARHRLDHLHLFRLVGVVYTDLLQFTVARNRHLVAGHLFGATGRRPAGNGHPAQGFAGVVWTVAVDFA